MSVMLSYIERNNGIDKELLYKMRDAMVEKAAESMEKPTEDVYLIIDQLVAKIKWKQLNNY